MVLPGEFLATTEEFVTGRGVYEENGKIYASLIGKSWFDSSRRLSVSGKEIQCLKPGDSVYGIVYDIFEKIALIKLDRKAETVGDSIAFLRVSELSNGYARTIREFVRIGDVLKAKIIEVRETGTYLTIKDSELGVVKAFCSKCRNEMNAENNLFHCKECGSIEKRKVPGNYSILENESKEGFRKERRFRQRFKEDVRKRKNFERRY